MSQLISYRTHLKKTFSLAYPVMLSQMGHVMVGIADSVMVGQLGPTPLAASSFANSILSIFLMFGIGLSYGVTPLVAKADGEKDSNQIIRLLRHNIILSLVSGLLLFVLLWAVNYLMPFMSQPEEVVTLGIPYFLIISASMFPLMVFQGFRQFAEGKSVTKPIMYISILANVLNVILNYLLIYGKLGFPAMGLNGAGWATLISRVLMAVGLFVFVYQYSGFKVYREGFNLLKAKLDLFKPMLKIGVPSGIQFVFEVGAFAMAAIMMGWLGTLPLAAHQIAISLVTVSYMLATGISAASTVRVGNQIGFKDGPNLIKVGNTSFLMAILMMATCSAVYIIFHGFFPTLYVSRPDVIELAGSLLIIAGLFQLSDGIQVVGLGCLRGMSDVKVPTYITLFAYWGLAIPASYLLGFTFGFGAQGIWYGLLIGLTVAAALLYFRFRRLSSKILSTF